MESIRASKLLLSLVSFSFRSSVCSVASGKNKKDEVHVLTVENVPPKEFKTMINFIHESKDENIKTEVGKMDLNSLLVLLTLFNKHFLAGESNCFPSRTYNSEIQIYKRIVNNPIINLMINYSYFRV